VTVDGRQFHCDSRVGQTGPGYMPPFVTLGRTGSTILNSNADFGSFRPFQASSVRSSLDEDIDKHHNQLVHGLAEIVELTKSECPT
jgi:hypothetical protein